jgi:hypothetical protein
VFGFQNPFGLARPGLAYGIEKERHTHHNPSQAKRQAYELWLLKHSHKANTPPQLPNDKRAEPWHITKQPLIVF